MEMTRGRRLAVLTAALVLLAAGTTFAIVDLGSADQIASVGSFGLGLVALITSLVSQRGGRTEKPSVVDYVYDSGTEPEVFRSWTYFAERGVTAGKFPRDSDRTIGMIATDQEAVGLNKSLPLVSAGRCRV
jgi:hypothetical protein